jgi:WD40 repeat protein
VGGQRIALVVAVDRYQHAGLRQLIAPAADAAALAQVLGDPALGGFDVEVLHNATASVICERVEDVLTDRKQADLVLLHFSCHGLKDDAGELYLAATNTVPTRLASTGVDAALVNRLMRRSRARRVVLLLDCCYGGAFERGAIARAGGGADVGNQFSMGVLGGGRGRAVITASSAMEYAFEGTTLAESSSARPSVFTAALVEGLTTGEADRDNDGHVSLGELYDYVFERVREQSPSQTPCKWEFDLQGELYLARNPRRRVIPGKLPPDVVELLAHPNVEVRLTAVRMLEEIARGDDLPRATAARIAFSELADDDSRRVSMAADRALQETALRLSVETVDFGQVAVGDTAESSETQLIGPPLVLASSIVVPDDRVNARLEGRTVLISWEPEESRTLDTAVTMTGPAGQVLLPVKGQAVAVSTSVEDRDVESEGKEHSRPEPEAQSSYGGAWQSVRPAAPRPPEPATPTKDLVPSRTEPDQPPQAGLHPHRRTTIIAVLIVTVALVLLATGIAIWNAALSPLEERVLTRHTGAVNAVATAQLNGHPVIVSGGDDYMVRVSDLATGTPIGQPIDRPRYVHAVATAQHDGRPVMVSGGGEGTVRVWELTTGNLLGESPTAPTSYVCAVATAQLNGQPVIVSGGGDGAVRVWEDLDTVAPIGEPLTGHTSYACAVATAQLDNRPVIVSGGGDGTVRVWDLATGTPIGQPLTGHSPTVLAVATAQLDGRPVIISGGGDGTVRVWDLATGTPIGQPLTGHTKPVSAVTTAQLDGRPVIISGGGDATVRIWDLATGTPIGQPLTGHTKPVSAVTTAQLDSRPVIISGSADGTIRTWDLATRVRS